MGKLFTIQVILMIIVIISILLFICWRDTNRFVTRYYRIQSNKVSRKYKFVFLSDFHEKEYEKDNYSLVNAILNENPDCVLIGGDVIVADEARFEHNKWYEKTMSILEKLVLKFPVFIVDGNHETKLKTEVLWDGNTLKHCWDSLYNSLENIGVKAIHNTYVKYDEIDIYGLEIDISYYEEKKRTALDVQEIETLIGKSNGERFEILLAHNPVFFQSYAKWGADIILAGHFHGGIVKLGKRGIFGADRKFFGKYCCGCHVLLQENSNTETSKMIVSCGLGSHTIPIRLFNPGEITVVEIVPS